jgi:hypothetical protein
MIDDQVDDRISDAFDVVFSDEPPTSESWGDVIARASRAVAPARRRSARPLHIVGAALVVLLLVPAVLLASRAWHLAVGDSAPAPIRHELGKLGESVSVGFPRQDAARARIVASARSSRGILYVLEGPSLPRQINSPGGKVTIMCMSVVTTFPLDVVGETRVTVAGQSFWLDRNGSCGGVPPASTHPKGLTNGTSEVLDEHLAVAYGHLGANGSTIHVQRANGQRAAIPTWRGFFLLISSDDGAPTGDRVISATIRDAQGHVVNTPRIALLTAAASLKNPLVGTDLVSGVLLPGRVALSPARTTVVRHPPAAIAIRFENSGGRTLRTTVTLEVRVNDHTYVRPTRVRLVPGASRTVRVSLPNDLPPKNTITARTRLLPGERNRSNNQRTWRVSIRP